MIKINYILEVSSKLSEEVYAILITDEDTVNMKNREDGVVYIYDAINKKVVCSDKDKIAQDYMKNSKIKNGAELSEIFESAVIGYKDEIETEKQLDNYFNSME